MHAKGKYLWLEIFTNSLLYCNIIRYSELFSASNVYYRKFTQIYQQKNIRPKFCFIAGAVLLNFSKFSQVLPRFEASFDVKDAIFSVQFP